ncbi:ribitol type dehydrogenase [Nocardia sputorum]|uniref:SDR family oxidoreductase n=1 Tax=Nocardia sputorum TaxID=2984338 RepID=UPI0024909AC1|nr:SDR family oxidoreductase [Nocardia sputorum]BDT92379.1 ribitol type dehydrogenase [Nocardia sputorum]
MTTNEFNGKHVVITGGSSGIGQAAAWQFAAMGANVTIIARRSGPLAATARACGVLGRIQPMRGDVTDRTGLEQLIAAATSIFGPTDVLLCCAGTAHPDYFDNLHYTDFEYAMNTNYFGTLNAVRAVLPAMRARNTGHLALMCSGAALMGLFGYGAYGPSKFAVRGLAETLRGELSGTGVGVSIVYPPDVDTPQLAEEDRTKPAELGAISGSARAWSADEVAEKLIRGITRGSFAIPCGGAMTTLVYGHSILAPWLNRVFDRKAARARKDMGA